MKARFGGLDVSEARRLKALEDENAKLKRMLADAMLDNDDNEKSCDIHEVSPRPDVRQTDSARVGMALINDGLVHSDPASQFLNLSFGAPLERSADVCIATLQRL